MTAEEIAKLLEAKGLQRVRIQKEGDNVMACCPFHEETRPSFGVKISTLDYNCFACHASGHLSMLFKEVEQEGEESVTLASIEKELSGLQAQKQGRTRRAKAPPTLPLAQAPPEAQDYLTRTRRIPTEITDQFGARWWPERHSFFFPVHDSLGNYVTYTRKAYPGGEWIHEPGGGAKGFLYGLNHIQYRRRVVVVEGVLDALYLWQFHYRAVATLGSKVTAAQLTLLSEFERVFWLFDGDEPGYTGRENAIAGMRRLDVEHFIVDIPLDPETEKPRDPNDLDMHELTRLLSSAEVYKWKSLLEGATKI